MSEILLVNPRKRRRATKKRRVTRKRAVARRRNPVRRKRSVRRRRRNPRVTARGVQAQLMTASTGALGALGLDIALAYIPLPAQFTGGMVGKVVKMAGAVALGVVAHQLGATAVNANRMAEGALTVQLHGIGKDLMMQFAPQIALSAYMDEGMGYYGSGWNPGNENGLNSYLTDISADQMGIDNANLGMYEHSEAGY
jgi:hypothetical protein